MIIASGDVLTDKFNFNFIVNVRGTIITISTANPSTVEPNLVPPLADWLAGWLMRLMIQCWPRTLNPTNVNAKGPASSGFHKYSAQTCTSSPSARRPSQSCAKWDWRDTNSFKTCKIPKINSLRNRFDSLLPCRVCRLLGQLSYRTMSDLPEFSEIEAGAFANLTLLRTMWEINEAM